MPHVLIIGETGTGKELAARSLRPFERTEALRRLCSVDSATIAASMAKSILFGHEKGAFTGADEARPGLFEQASGA
jgi:transcriptional regulator with AAA-type ATPase domain